MDADDLADEQRGEEGWPRRDRLAALFLFAASGAVVVWQNSRLGVLWDISYILENAYRISLGDMPYRDFPFPYAPITFLTQAALIKLTGRVFWHHVVYSATLGALASVVSYRILCQLMRATMPRPRLTAFLLSVPLVALGIYAIYPHPFYDPDCTFFILVCILLLLHAARKGFPPALTFLTGTLFVGPLFIKQNTGLACLLSVLLAFVALLLGAAWRKSGLRGYGWLLTGIVVALAGALLLIQLTAGLDNYVRWTIRFAAARRTPTLADMLEVYQNWLLLLWLAAFACGALLWWRGPARGRRAGACLSAALMSLPFVWAVVSLFLTDDASQQAERLLAVWPFVLVTSTVVAILGLRRREGVAFVLPFILIATAHGAFLSQQLWGSTYGLWPLLLLLVGSQLTTLCALINDGPAGAATGRVVWPYCTIVCASLLVAGGHYIWTHERLDYADLDDGALLHSSQPALRGLRLRGSYLPDFEELVAYTDREIPRDAGILMLPGEDLFYYTTGRRPRCPVLMFDRTVNPYSPADVAAIARARDINWLVVKQDLQIDDPQVEQDKEQMLEVLKRDFKQVESLNNYDIYRRRTNADQDEEQDDEPDDESDSDK